MDDDDGGCHDDCDRDDDHDDVDDDGGCHNDCDRNDDHNLDNYHENEVSVRFDDKPLFDVQRL